MLLKLSQITFFTKIIHPLGHVLLLEWYCVKLWASVYLHTKYVNVSAFTLASLLQKAGSSMNMHYSKTTIMILNIRTNRSGKTVQTQIRLLLEEQSDQGLHSLLFPLHYFDKIHSGLASLFQF